MMRQYELVERVAKYNPKVDEALLNRAYVYAMQKHGDQKRASGDPYFSHPLEVAAILTELRLDDASIAVALLHDTIEDTDATRQEIDQLFGAEIGKLVEGLTKIRRLDLVSSAAKQAENFRKLLLAVADDVRVLLVKLADRLHNMRTIRYVPPDKRTAIAAETMEIYAPLAGRMGMQGLRDELEGLAFEVLDPKSSDMIKARLDALRAGNRGLIQSIESDLKARLASTGIDAEVMGREKRPYAIFQKMQRKSISFEQLSDIYGFRVIVSDIPTCYRVLGVIHSTWPMVPGRFKDYISTPKQNDYRSIHTTVVGPRAQRVELQIRTAEMHRTAEYGIAAHVLYKDLGGQGNGTGRRGSDSRAYEWLKKTIDLLSIAENPEEFLEHTKLELFHDQVFCFTPKGRLIALPRGATPIDFAYSVHTDVGNSCVGCKINGHIKPIATQLENGDEVEIIRSETQVPAPAWQTIAVTGKARAAIRRATRDAERKQYLKLGQHLLDDALARRGKLLSAGMIKTAAAALDKASGDELLAAIGRGEVPIAAALGAIDPSLKPNGEDGHDEATRDRAGGSESRPVPIRGVFGDLPVKFAPECGAVPGDRIVGVLTPGSGVTVYPVQAPALAAIGGDRDRFVEVRWDVDRNARATFPVQIAVSAVNEPGSLAKIAGIVADLGANIDNLRMTRRAKDFTEMRITLEVRDLRHLTDVLAALAACAVVSSATRVLN